MCGQRGVGKSPPALPGASLPCTCVCPQYCSKPDLYSWPTSGLVGSRETRLYVNVPLGAQVQS